MGNLEPPAHGSFESQGHLRRKIWTQNKVPKMGPPICRNSHMLATLKTCYIARAFCSAHARREWERSQQPQRTEMSVKRYMPAGQSRKSCLGLPFKTPRTTLQGGGSAIRKHDFPCMVPRAPILIGSLPSRRLSPSPCCHSPCSAPSQRVGPKELWEYPCAQRLTPGQRRARSARMGQRHLLVGKANY